MDAAENYILEEITRIYSIYQYSPHKRDLHQNHVASEFLGDRMKISVALMAEISFHEAQSLIYNTIIERMDELIKKIRDVKSKMGTPEPISDRGRILFVKLGNLYSIIGSLLPWLHPIKFHQHIGIALSDYGLGSQPSHQAPKQFDGVEAYEKEIIKILHSCRANPVAFEKKIRNQWNHLISLTEGKDYSDFYYQEQLTLLIACNEEYDAVDCLRCALILNEVSVKYFVFRGIYKKLGNSYPLEYIRSDIGKVTWDFDKEQWIRLFEHFDDVEYLTYFLSKCSISVDLVDALLESYEPEILITSWRTPPISGSIIDRIVKSCDVELLFQLIESPQLNETVNEQLSDKLDRELQFFNKIGFQVTFGFGVRFLKELLPGTKVDRHCLKTLDRYRKFITFFQRLPMLKMRIIHTRRQGGVSVLEENGLREFLEYKSFVPDFELEDALMNS
jgi:hypothetical protein